MKLDVLKTWPDWQAIRLLGEGSFGKVYEIVRNNFGIEEHCALKVITIPSSESEIQSLKSEGLSDQDTAEYYRGLVEEFVQEIALMSKLKGNAHIVRYEDYAVIEHSDGIGWDIIIRMELLTALPQYMQKHPMSVNEVIQMVTDICSALEVCHEQKIIHRDIKPDNIFISSNGEFKLGDFGVAKTIEKTISALSKKGTYTYMAPEVYRGEYYTTNVDLYSLGIVAYRLLNNNREPFLPPHPQPIKYTDKSNALVRRINGDLIEPPVHCDERLGRMILKAVSFHSNERYQTASQMKADLLAYKNGVAVSGASTSAKPAVPPINATIPVNPPVASRMNPQVSFPVKPQIVQPVKAPTSSVDWVKSFTDQPEPANRYVSNRLLYICGLILGWLGVFLWFILSMDTQSAFFVFCTLMVLGSMVLLSIPKLQRVHKWFSIVMLLFSVLSFNIFDLASAILCLCIKPNR